MQLRLKHLTSNHSFKKDRKRFFRVTAGMYFIWTQKKNIFILILWYNKLYCAFVRVFSAKYNFKASERVTKIHLKYWNTKYGFVFPVSVLLHWLIIVNIFIIIIIIYFMNNILITFIVLYVINNNFLVVHCEMEKNPMMETFHSLLPFS